MWLKKKHLIKTFFKEKKKSSGRSFGKITTHHRGGGFRIKKILIDYSRFLWNMPGIVRTLEKDKSHGTYIASIFYPCGMCNYIIAPENLKPGRLVMSGDLIPPTLGSHLLSKNIPFNTKIHNIESFPRSGGKYIRSAGNWAKILEKKEKKALLLFKNGKKKLISLNCAASIGRVSNIQHIKSKILKKAGENRLLNKRPRVRGVVKNPVDHPHGGGKGKKSPKNPNYNFIRKLPKGRKTSARK